MEFAPSPEQREWQEKAQKLAAERLAPRAADHDRRGVFPHDNFADLRREGFLRLAVPPGYGGLWVDHRAYALVMEALGAGCASTTCCLAMHFGCAFHVLAAGSRAQKERFMAWIVREEKLFAVATTDATPGEPGASGIVTAHPAAGGFRLNGCKYFVTSAGAADAYIVRASFPEATAEDGGRGSGVGCREGDDASSQRGARSDPSDPSGRHPTPDTRPPVESGLFVVPAQQDGVRVEERWDGMGLRASSTNTVVFDDCFAPEEDLLRGPVEPEPVSLYPTAGFSLGLAAWPLGAAAAAFEYAREQLRGAPGRPARPLSQEKRMLLARMHVDLQSARWLLRHAAWVADTTPDQYLMPVQTARYACTTQALAITERALWVVGGRGYLQRNPLERLLRDLHAGPLQMSCHEQCLERVTAELLRPV